MTPTRTGSARLVVVLAALLALAGCQTGQDATTTPAAPDDPASVVSPEDPVSDDDPVAAPTPSDEPAAPGTPLAADLTVVVDATGKGATTTSTLTCEPVGGDHPDAAAACAAIAAGGLAAFDPTPMGVACTEQWGGPQTATVTGTVGGETVNARFSRTNGCEISRWDALEALFGPDPGLQ